MWFFRRATTLMQKCKMTPSFIKGVADRYFCVAIQAVVFPKGTNNKILRNM